MRTFAPGRQCVRIKRDGTRCQNAAILGGTVCMKHGGAVATTRAAAQRRLLKLVDPALAALDKVLVDRNACPVCGRSDDPHAIVKASTVVLDRAGFNPKQVIEIEHNDEGWLRFLEDDEFETVAALMEKAQQRMPAAELSLDDEDAEQVH